MSISRKHFITHSLAGFFGLAVIPLDLKGAGPLQNPDKGPPLDPLLVKEFVAAAHKDMARVVALYEETPALLNSVHNLGGWDWEDAVGATGHVGHAELANFLLSKGARMTICVAAMLGKTEIVKLSVEAFPYMKNAVGPHNISLMRHAKAGGKSSEDTVQYLLSIGIKE